MPDGNYVNIGQNILCDDLLVTKAIQGSPLVNVGALTATQITVNGNLTATNAVGGGDCVDALFTATGQTGNFAALFAQNSGSFDTTAAPLTAYGVWARAFASRSAGANTLTDIAVFADAVNGQANFALVTSRGDVVLNQASGQTTVNGPFAATNTVNLGTFARVTGSNFVTSSTSLVDVTGLTAALVANAVYQFTAILSINSSTVAGMTAGVQFSAAGAAVEAQAQGTLAAGGAQAVRVSALNTATAAFDTAGTDGGIEINGILTTGVNAGNLTIRVAKVTSGNATVFQQSYLSVQRVA